MLMAVMVPREKWSDERLDDLDKKVGDGFADVRLEMRSGFVRVDGEIRELRQEMNHRFDRVDGRFDSIDARFDALNQRLFMAAVAVIVAMVGAAGAIVAAMIGTSVLG